MFLLILAIDCSVFGSAKSADYWLFFDLVLISQNKGTLVFHLILLIGFDEYVVVKGIVWLIGFYQEGVCIFESLDKGSSAAESQLAKQEVEHL